jgi:hypothetical protein
MPWRVSLHDTARDSETAERVIAAVDLLLTSDAYLFEAGVGERALSHRLGIYIEANFKGWHVDCEYDRDGVDPKRIPGGSGNDDDEGSRVLPDIIVHRRGSGPNLLVMELKKSTNREPDDRDMMKLRAYTEYLGYIHGVFIRFLVGAEAPGVERAEFVYSS